MGTNEAPAGLTRRSYTGKKLYACFQTNNDSDTDFCSGALVPTSVKAIAVLFLHPVWLDPTNPLCPYRSEQSASRSDQSYALRKTLLSVTLTATFQSRLRSIAALAFVRE